MSRQTKHSTDWLTIKAYWAASKRYPLAFFLTWLTPIGALCLSILIPFFVGRILAGLAHGTTNLTAPLTGLIVSGIVAIVTNRIAFNHYLDWQAKVMADLQSDAFVHLLHRGTSFHNNRIAGKLVSDAVDYPQSFLRFTDGVFVQSLPFLVTTLVGITIIMIQAPIIGLTVLVMSILAISSSILFRTRMAPNRHRRLNAGKAVTARVADTITNNQTVKAFGREAFELKQFEKLNATLLQYRRQDWHALAVNGNNRIIGLFAFEIVFVIAIIHQIHHHPALLATGIFAFSYTVTLTNRLFDIGNMMRTIEEALLQAEPMTEMLQAEREIVDVPGAPDLKVSAGAINFNDVDFHYSDNSGDAVFQQLQLSIAPGEKIGLVGPSGGGKSTLSKLLLRFEDITAGQILVDEQNIAEVTQQSLHQSIGYVAQEPLLFHRTIKENIAYGRPAASDADIIAAAEKAYAADFIATLPKKYDTVVGERGVKLSGGQRQRIAIARAILKDAPILLLDEATSALDSESEKVIQHALWKLMEHKTAIVIAHRLSTIQKLDRIIVLDEGKIVENGSHAELLKNNGLYARLWSHQSGGFLED